MPDKTKIKPKVPTQTHTKLFALLCFGVLLVCMASPLGNFLNSKGGYFYDDFSDNLLKVDIHYTKHFGLDGPFAHYLELVTPLPGGVVFKNTTEVRYFVEGDGQLPPEVYSTYLSNLCVQRYGYTLLSLLPLPPQTLFSLLGLINTALFALALAGVLVWVRAQTNTWVALAVLGLLAFFSPILTNYAPNLYWVPYIWFIPLLGAAGAVGYKEKAKTEKQWYHSIFWLSAATCLFVQLHHFEFISSVMIAMMLPYLCDLLQHSTPFKQPKRWCKTLLWPFLGGVLSFVLAMGTKVAALVLAEYPGKQQKNALSMVVQNILSRTNGAQYKAQLAAEGYDTSLKGVLHAMFSAQPLVLRSRFDVSFYVLVALLLMVTAMVLVLRAWHSKDGRKLGVLLGATWVSFSAPLFWFVVGRLHVVAHSKIDLVVWYIPFVPLAYATLAYFLYCVATAAYQKAKVKKCTAEA